MELFAVLAGSMSTVLEVDVIRVLAGHAPRRVRHGRRERWGRLEPMHRSLTLCKPLARGARDRRRPCSHFDVSFREAPTVRRLTRGSTGPASHPDLPNLPVVSSLTSIARHWHGRCICDDTSDNETELTTSGHRPRHPAVAGTSVVMIRTGTRRDFCDERFHSPSSVVRRSLAGCRRSFRRQRPAAAVPGTSSRWESACNGSDVRPTVDDFGIRVDSPSCRRTVCAARRRSGLGLGSGRHASPRSADRPQAVELRDVGTIRRASGHQSAGSRQRSPPRARPGVQPVQPPRRSRLPVMGGVRPLSSLMRMVPGRRG
jgi:hypothetical protein